MNTRFNPTANGPLHIGHVYMALVNETKAHDSGGEFTLRIDDNQRRYYEVVGGVQRMRELGEAQHKDLEWMGLQIDHVNYQSDREEDAKHFLERKRVVVNYPTSGGTLPVIHGAAIEPWPLSSRLTLEKVVLDNWDGVTWVARGMELLQEHQLYMYICDILGFPFPECHYLPRLMVKGDTVISKTIGNWRLKYLREADVTPERIRQVLRESCLRLVDGPWSVDNILTFPRLNWSTPP